MNLEEFTNLAQMQGMMFLLLLTGIIARKLNIITLEGKKCLMDVIISIILPCNIFISFDMEFSMAVIKEFSLILVISILIQIGCMIISKVAYINVDENKKPVLQYGTVCSNAGFLGNPVAETIYGSLGLTYASIYLIPQRIVMWSAGISYFTHTSNRKETIKKVLTHPCIIAVFLGILWMISGIKLPVVVYKTTKSIGGCCTAMSMITIGAILGDVDLKNIISKLLIEYTVIRLAIIPLLVLIGCRLCNINDFVTGISVTLAAMPAGSTTAILAAKYNGDEFFATKCVVLTTVISLITIPIWSFILHY